MNFNFSSGSWDENYRLGDGCKIKHGFAFKGDSMTTDDDETLPIVVNIVNFQYTGGFRFESTKIQRYVGPYPQEFELHPGDVLLVMTCQTPKGEILGIPGRIPRDKGRYLHNQRMGLAVVHDKKALDLAFLYYLFLSQDFNRHLFATSTGAKILHTAPGRIEDYRFSRPPIHIQRRIAAILSAYDDLIENNTRRIKIVKEIAATVFTNAANQSPEDWDTVPIHKVYSGFFDGPHATPKPSDEGPVFLGIKNVTESGELDLTDIRHIAEDDFQQWTRRVVPEFGDIVFSYEATLYRYAIINRGFRGCLGRRLALIRPNPEKIDAYILLRCLLSDEWRREVQSKVISGATVDRIPLVTFPNFMIRVPNRKLQKRIGPTIRACEELAENCRRRNDLLRRTRDLLLPKLISGQVSVKAAEYGAAAIEEEIALHA